MRLYFAPGACSLADHIALEEAGIAFDPMKVDLKAHMAEDGRDYRTVNPKGYVPALVFDDGEMGRYRLLEMLAYLSTELHKAFKPFFNVAADAADKTEAAKVVERRLDFIAERLTSDYLFGRDVCVADPYLFVMLTWADKNGLRMASPLPAYLERMRARPAVRRALQREGLL